MTTGSSTFSEPLRKRIESYLTRYETRRSAILPILHCIQDECGWVQDQHIDALERQYQLHPVEVREVLTFYSMYRQEAPRKFEIYFCNNLVCHMLGAKATMDRIAAHVTALEQELGPDCPFRLRPVPCLGVCDGAPAMLVNKDRHLKVTPERIDEILQKYAPLPKSAGRKA